MRLLDAANSAAQNAITLTDAPHLRKSRKGTIAISTRKLRSAIEHLPSVNTQRLRVEKFAVLAIMIPLNLTLLYMFKSCTTYFWWLAPLALMRLVVDVIEITSIFIFYWYRRVHPRVSKVPKTPESFVYLMCCYNETYPELMVSLNSLAAQKSIDDHKKAILVVCDGHVSSKGMTKTAAAHLKEDIIERPSSISMSRAYTSWDGALMDIELVKGEFKGLPIVCLIKNENRGKRDSIVLARSFFRKFNLRQSKPALAMLTPELFTELSGFFENAGIQSLDYAVGIDADTRFDVECVSSLIQTVREGEQVIGVTGYIQPDPVTSSTFSFSYLYQMAEYMVGQHRRRLRQSLTSGRVTCLPGCCQLLRVLESTCGDDILAKFGYYPKATDSLFRTVRSMMSEDRDHICLVLSENADVQTRQCLGARAYTTVPSSPSVFLSQRRRWTLGPLTSDCLLVKRRSTGYVERLAALCSVIQWIVQPSLFLSKHFRSFGYTTQTVVFFLEHYRMVWDILCIILRTGSPLEGIQLMAGAMLYAIFAPPINFITHLYTLYNLDDFRWGKTRIAVSKN